MIKQDEIYDSYIRPFSLVEKLKLKCGYEKSFKLTDQHLLRNRYLLGIDKAELDHDKLSFICNQMGMPKKFVENFFTNISDANLILLGFEEGDGDCTYKIYLEYWDKIRKNMKRAQPPYEPVTLFLGYKWSVFDNSQSALTNYVYYPMITVDEIIKRMCNLNTLDEDEATFEVARNIITHSAKRVNNRPFIYLEASEGNNPRKSFDINLYRAGINLRNIYPFLKQLCRHYSVRIDELDKLYSRVDSRVLGHLSGGIDRDGKGFLTVYYETEAA
ncbi:MAG: hypothetical protein ACC663_02645 [Gammaproteobacteria bacterium]